MLKEAKDYLRALRLLMKAGRFCSTTNGLPKLPMENYHDCLLYEILRQDVFPKKVRSFDKKLTDIPFTITTAYNESANIFMTTKPIYVENTDTKLTMLSFRPEREMHVIANKLNTSRAIFTFDSIIGNSVSIMETKRIGKTAADSISNVLILGGKRDMQRITGPDDSQCQQQKKRALYNH